MKRTVNSVFDKSFERETCMIGYRSREHKSILELFSLPCPFIAEKTQIFKTRPEYIVYAHEVYLKNDQ